jgi:hypothetical protein
MIYVKFDGRLCNNFFQLAAGLSIAIDNNDEVVAPPTNFYKFINYTPKFESFVQHSVHYNEPHFHYSKIPYTKDMLITGFFQSEKYFANNKDAILEKLYLKDVYVDQIKNKYKDLLKEETISLHVRRSDYLNMPQYHPVLPISYYSEALQKLSTKGKKVVVFSDDITWCKEKFQGEKFVFIENNLPIVDLYLMSFCKENIIANSSFSWWGAYFNRSSKKRVIAPKLWFGPGYADYITSDLYCSGWEVI